MREQLEELLSEQRFSRFVVTTHDGFAIAVTNPRKTLLGSLMMVLMDEKGMFFHIPYTSIAHLSEPQQ